MFDWCDFSLHVTELMNKQQYTSKFNTFLKTLTLRKSRSAPGTLANVVCRKLILQLSSFLKTQSVI